MDEEKTEHATLDTLATDLKWIKDGVKELKSDVKTLGDKVQKQQLAFAKIVGGAALAIALGFGGASGLSQVLAALAKHFWP